MLTYYQAIELMSCLPALLSSAKDKTVFDDEQKISANLDIIEDMSEMESWYLVNRSIAANGEYFTD